jgi:hypothetical protein
MHLTNPAGFERSGNFLCRLLGLAAKYPRDGSTTRKSRITGAPPSPREPASFQAVPLVGPERTASLLLESSDNVETIVDPRDAAESTGLRYVLDARPGICRKKAGTGFSYTRADGSKLTEKNILKRIKALAIPPAWTEVWIGPFSDGHIQATGRDAKGRKQYRYHPRFREVRESTKYEHVVAFADALPAIREKVQEHMGLRGLPREKVLAISSAA